MTGEGRPGAVAGLLTCLLWAPPALVAVGGFLTLSGPLNSGNGLVGGMAAPVGVWWSGSAA